MSSHSMASGVAPMGSLDGDFLDGAVSAVRFLALYGVEHLEVVEALLTAEGTVGVILFSNENETEYALLPVGAAHRFKTFESAMAREHEGMHAVCHTLAGGTGTGGPLVMPESGWPKIKREFPAEAEEIEEIITDSGDSDAALVNVLRHLVGAKQQINYARVRLGRSEEAQARREEHVAASAARIEELMQKYGAWETLHEQMTLLESREKFVHEAEDRLLRRAQELDTYAVELAQEASLLPVRAK